LSAASGGFTGRVNPGTWGVGQFLDSYYYSLKKEFLSKKGQWLG